MILYTASVREKPQNTWYDHKYDILTNTDLRCALEYDYTGSEFNGRRAKNNFIIAHTFILDVDNTHTEEPSQWLTFQDMETMFPDLFFYVHYSRNHLKTKDGKKARPKFHVLFPLDVPLAKEEFELLAERMIKLHPAFDPACCDCSRFFFGTEHPQTLQHNGYELLSLSSKFDMPPLASYVKGAEEKAIKVGERNNTLFKSACQIIEISYDYDTAFYDFMAEADKCEVPLSNSELDQIFSSAKKRVRLGLKAKPQLTQIKLAEQFLTYYDDILSDDNNCYIFDGQRWRLNGQELRKRYISFLGDTLEKTKDEATLRFLRSQSTNVNINAVLQIVQTLSQSEERFNSKPTLLNFLNGTLDLHNGIFREHDPNDMLTQMLKFNYGDVDTKDEIYFSTFINQICSGDKDKARLLQEIAALSIYGANPLEHLYFFIGNGKNGKSTFLNFMQSTLGDYAVRLSSDVFKTTQMSELARLQDKRFCCFTESDKKLNGSLIKRLVSCDPVVARRLYENPFEFIPTHTSVIALNVRPDIKNVDGGVQRRLKYISFDSVFTNADTSLPMNLNKHCKMAFLKWAFEGYQRLENNSFTLSPYPEADYNDEVIATILRFFEPCSSGEMHSAKSIQSFLSGQGFDFSTLLLSRKLMQLFNTTTRKNVAQFHCKARKEVNENE